MQNWTNDLTHLELWLFRVLLGGGFRKKYALGLQSYLLRFGGTTGARVPLLGPVIPNLRRYDWRCRDVQFSSLK